MSGSVALPEGKHQKHPHRKRTMFTEKQLEDLNHFFNRNPYPDPSLKREMASRMNLDPTVLQVWFKNHRAKLKKEKRHIQQKQEARCQQPAEDEAKTSPPCRSLGTALQYPGSVHPTTQHHQPAEDEAKTSPPCRSLGTALRCPGSTHPTAQHHQPAEDEAKTSPPCRSLGTPLRCPGSAHPTAQCHQPAEDEAKTSPPCRSLGTALQYPGSAHPTAQHHQPAEDESKTSPPCRSLGTPLQCPGSAHPTAPVFTHRETPSFQLSICPPFKVLTGHSGSHKMVHFGCCQDPTIYCLHPFSESQECSPNSTAAAPDPWSAPRREKS